MDLTKSIPYPNDLSFKYLGMIMGEYLHKYLDLPGNYDTPYPTETITKDMRNPRMDILYKSDDNILYDIEAQTKKVNDSDLKRFTGYRIFAENTYGMPLNTVIITLINPELLKKEYRYSKTDILKPIYIYYSPSEIEEKINNLEHKIKHGIPLVEKEPLDLAFAPLFTQKEHSQETTIKMCELLKKRSKFERKTKNGHSIHTTTNDL